MFDLIIKGGRVVDGSGADACVARRRRSRDGAIAAIGALGVEAREIVDARDRIVAPGFIDPHTHFDVQLLWDGAARPALEHGVTTVVPGQLFVVAGAAEGRRPPRAGRHVPADRGVAARGVHRGVRVDVGELRRLSSMRSRRSLSINVAPLVGHSVIRLWVMGAASQQRAATAERDRRDAGPAARVPRGRRGGLEHQLRRRRREAAPGAEPLRVSRGARRRSRSVLGEYGRMLQVVPEFYATDLTIARIDQLAELSLKYGIPTTFSPLFDSAATPRERAAHDGARRRAVRARRARLAAGADAADRHQLFVRTTEPVLRALPELVPRDAAAARRAHRGAARYRYRRSDGRRNRRRRRSRDVLGRLRVRGGEGAPADLVGRTLADIADERRRNRRRSA